MASIFGYIAFAIVFLAVAAGIVFFEAFVIQCGWNVVFPAVFGLPAISLLQALALSVLLSIIGSAFRAKGDKK